MASKVQYFWQQRRWYQRIGFSALFGLLVLLTGLAPAYADTSTTSAQVLIFAQSLPWRWAPSAAPERAIAI